MATSPTTGKARLSVQAGTTAESQALPVVATRYSGIAEAVQHGATGLLVEEHDVAGMAAAMADLHADPARAAGMGDAGRRRVIERYTQAVSCGALRAIMGLGP